MQMINLESRTQDQSLLFLCFSPLKSLMTIQVKCLRNLGLIIIGQAFNHV